MSDPVVYVLRDSEGEVIYVGQTIDLGARLRHHRSNQAWGSEIASVETYPMADRCEAELAERQFIADLSPRYNEITYISTVGSPRQALPEGTADQLRRMLNDAREGGPHSHPDAVLSNFIKLLRVNGWTLAAIGEPLGWTREAVRLREVRGELVGNLPIPPIPPQPRLFLTPPKVRRLRVRPEIADQLRALTEQASLCRATRDRDHPNRQASVELSAMLAALNEQGVTLSELARCCAVTPGAIRLRLARHGYMDPPPSYRDVRFGTRPGGTAKTHCKRGHEFTDDNVYWSPSGQRNCKACQRQREAAYKARRGAAA